MKKSFSQSLKDNTMLIVLVVVYLFFTWRTSGSMFSPFNFNELITQNAYVFILASGMLMCMLTGGNIDLACGAFVCFLGAVGAYFMMIRGMGIGVSILLMLLIGIAYGCALGYLIAFIKIPPWIATLAGFLAFRGLGTNILSSNSTTGSISIKKAESFLGLFAGKLFKTKMGVLNMPCITVTVIAAILVIVLNVAGRINKQKKGYEVDSLFSMLGKSLLEAAAILLVGYKLSMAGGIPTVLVWVAAVVLFYHFITEQTTIGRHFYVVGGNMEAARLSGVNTRRIMFIAYLNMAILTSIATMNVIARSQSAYADIGKNFEMDAISACVVGGVSASGGAGTVLGMVIGATLIGVINLGMSLISLDANYQRVIKGFVLLAAVVFDIVSKKREK